MYNYNKNYFKKQVLESRSPRMFPDALSVALCPQGHAFTHAHAHAPAPCLLGALRCPSHGLGFPAHFFPEMPAPLCSIHGRHVSSHSPAQRRGLRGGSARPGGPHPAAVGPAGAGVQGTRRIGRGTFQRLATRGRPPASP